MQYGAEAGFAGSKNGELLALAEREGFEIFVTLDKALPISGASGDGSLR